MAHIMINILNYECLEIIAIRARLRPISFLSFTDNPTLQTRIYYFFYKSFIAQKVSNIHLVTKDFKIVPLTNLLKLFLAGRVIGEGGSVLLGLY